MREEGERLKRGEGGAARVLSSLLLTREMEAEDERSDFNDVVLEEEMEGKGGGDQRLV